MTPSVDVQVQQIKDRIATAQRAQARAEHDFASANASLADTARALADEFGVTSLPAAQELLAELECRLADELTHINNELDQLVDTALPTF